VSVGFEEYRLEDSRRRVRQAWEWMLIWVRGYPRTAMANAGTFAEAFDAHFRFKRYDHSLAVDWNGWKVAGDRPETAHAVGPDGRRYALEDLASEEP
jgi:hypothetical protein